MSYQFVIIDLIKQWPNDDQKMTIIHLLNLRKAISRLVYTMANMMACCLMHLWITLNMRDYKHGFSFALVLCFGIATKKLSVHMLNVLAYVTVVIGNS